MTICRRHKHLLRLTFLLLVLAVTTYCLTIEEEDTLLQQFQEYFPTILFHHAMSTDSTQEEARRILSESEDTTVACVTATEQTNGRGTSGRVWMGAKGNTFVTIAIRQSDFVSHKIPLTLLPLQVGIFVARRVKQLLQQLQESTSHPIPSVTLKWPNDVLVNEEKIAGILIESFEDWFLIGIGVNVAYAPPVPTTGPNHGRKSTSIATATNAAADWNTIARTLGMDLATDLQSFLRNPTISATRIIEEWKGWADMNMELVMRDTPNQERVKVVDMLPDGRLQVVGQDDGVHRTLVSDYFF
eukprot:scaffold918_cov126-Cylindrotheca_fusiformis.AAC.6